MYASRIYGRQVIKPKSGICTIDDRVGTCVESKTHTHTGDKQVCANYIKHKLCMGDRKDHINCADMKPYSASLSRVV